LENKPVLQTSNLNVFHGKIQALWDICLKIDKSEIVAIVGANGAGKTTLLNTISGILRPVSGQVLFEGHRIDGLSPQDIVDLGVCHIPESRKLFPDMTVRENLEMGAYPRRAWKQKSQTLAGIYKLFPRLKERERQLARTLSGGEQQMLAMGRGLMSVPKLCLIDEPSYGLAPILVAEVFQVIKSLREQGITVLLIEQNVRRSLEIADRGYVMENGRICLEGACSDLLCSDYIQKAYLGL
jgi:branched-chain amino acid transport system ATP-binding protein